VEHGKLVVFHVCWCVEALDVKGVRLVGIVYSRSCVEMLIAQTYLEVWWERHNAVVGNMISDDSYWLA
jgi:hypothetical protein